MTLPRMRQNAILDHLFRGRLSQLVTCHLNSFSCCHVVSAQSVNKRCSLTHIRFHTLLEVGGHLRVWCRFLPNTTLVSKLWAVQCIILRDTLDVQGEPLHFLGVVAIQCDLTVSISVPLARLEHWWLLLGSGLWTRVILRTVMTGIALPGFQKSLHGCCHFFGVGIGAFAFTPLYLALTGIDIRHRQ